MKKIPTPTTSLPTIENNHLVKKILQAYGIEAVQISAPQKGYRNQSFRILGTHKATPINLIIYKREPAILEKIHNAHQLGVYLSSHGLAVRHPIDPRILSLKGEHRATYTALYNYLPGATIPWEAYTRKHIKLLGKTMSDMHALLEHCETPPQNTVIDEYDAILQRMKHYFADPLVTRALQEKLGTSLRYDFDRATRLLSVCRQLSRQALHMDFVRGNILFSSQGGELSISGILDFEKAATGPRLFDIARTLAFLLVDCKYIPEAKVWKYFIHSGYQKRGRAKLELHPALFNEIIDLFLMYDFYKFLRHNPYEYLGQNEHFVRTRQLLQKRQRLSVTKA